MLADLAAEIVDRDLDRADRRAPPPPESWRRAPGPSSPGRASLWREYFPRRRPTNDRARLPVRARSMRSMRRRCSNTPAGSTAISSTAGAPSGACASSATTSPDPPLFFGSPRSRARPRAGVGGCRCRPRAAGPNGSLSRRWPSASAAAARTSSSSTSSRPSSAAPPSRTRRSRCPRGGSARPSRARAAPTAAVQLVGHADPRSRASAAAIAAASSACAPAHSARNASGSAANALPTADHLRPGRRVFERARPRSRGRSGRRSAVAARPPPRSSSRRAGIAQGARPTRLRARRR